MVSEKGENTDLAKASAWFSAQLLKTDVETGLTAGEIESRLKEHGHNEVLEQKSAPASSLYKEVLGFDCMDARDDHRHLVDLPPIY